GDLVRLAIHFVHFGVAEVAANDLELDPSVVFAVADARHHVVVSLRDPLLVALLGWISSTTRHRPARELPAASVPSRGHRPGTLISNNPRLPMEKLAAETATARAAAGPCRIACAPLTGGGASDE